jgi:hypothetical protein
MPLSLLAALPLVLAGVLIGSGVSKLRVADDLSGWAALGVPQALRRQWLVRVHPWAEVALGIAVAVLGGLLGLLAALVAVALMVAYTWLIVRAVSRQDDTSCACFGARQRVTRVTVARNLWLTVLSVATTAVVWATPLIGGALVIGWSLIPALAVAAVTTALILWPEAETAAPVHTIAPVHADASGEGEVGDEADYIRTRTPAVPVTLADGTGSDLRRLTAARPVLLLIVSPTCGYCEQAMALRGAWRSLLPEVDVRLLLDDSPASSPWTEENEPQSLHDPDHRVTSSLADFLPTPAVVLLGVDGLLAGGPVSGPDIEPFIGDVYESLHGVRPPVTAFGKR